LNHARSTLNAAEAVAGETKDVVQVLHRLRRLSIEDFGLFFLGLPDPAYPALSALLPRMAAAEVQKSWTGSDGRTLLTQTLAFVQLVDANFQLITRQPLRQQPILDFGCGWGRIMRLFYYFSDPALIYGCDPWDESIEICRADRLLGNLALSDYLPHSLPFDRQKFDLIYAFSVFTHLSERAAATALKTLGEALSERGLLVITIRPVEYWRIHHGLPPPDRAALEAQHATRGFAYRPHNRALVDGDVTYGDTTMTLDYFEKQFPWFAIQNVERPAEDPYQKVLFLTKKAGI
jgi:hypothetical protein